MVELRQATEAEYPEIVALTNRAFRHTGEGASWNVEGVIQGDRINEDLLREDLAAPGCQLLIWREGVTPMFRELLNEEAMMWDEAANGIPFGVLCEMLATYDDPDGAAARGAGYLHGWITSGILTAVSAK